MATPSSHFLAIEKITHDLIIFSKAFKEIERFKGEPDNLYESQAWFIKLANRSFINTSPDSVLWLRGKATLSLINLKNLDIVNVPFFDTAFVTNYNPRILSCIINYRQDIVSLVLINNEWAIALKKKDIQETQVFFIRDIVAFFNGITSFSVCEESSFILIGGTTSKITKETNLGKRSRAYLAVLNYEENFKVVAEKDFGEDFQCVNVLKKMKGEDIFYLGCTGSIIEIQVSDANLLIRSITRLSKNEEIIDLCIIPDEQIIYVTKNSPKFIRFLQLDKNSK